jgi:hypothetical protein
MAVRYVPEWMPLLDAIQHMQRVAGSARKDACDALLIALCDGGVLSRVRGQAVRRGAGIDPEQWYRATVFCDGTVDFKDDPRFPLLRPFPPGLGPLRHQIEVRRSDVLKWWPAAGEPPESEPVTEQRADDKPTVRRSSSREKPFWADAQKAAQAWFEANGFPLPGDGGQTKLEKYIAGWLEERGHVAGESTIRMHVASWIKGYRDSLNSQGQ